MAMILYKHKNNRDTAIHILGDPKEGKTLVDFWNISDMKFGGKPYFCGYGEIKIGDLEKDYEKIIIRNTR